MRHPHADVIHAWAEGAKVQARPHKDFPWVNDGNPAFHIDWYYRVAPETTILEIPATNIELAEGETLVGCIYVPDGRREWIILLPGEFQGNWQESMEWAKSIGGELPDRVEGALMFSLPDIRAQFRPESYWTRESIDSQEVWYLGFLDGSQDFYSAHSTLRARAVRRVTVGGGE